MSILAVKASDPAVVTYPASAFVEQVNVEAGVLPYGADTIHNAFPYHDIDLNLVIYEFSFEEAANHLLSIEYAAEAPRPCDVFWYLKGDPTGPRLKNQPVLSQATGGWGTVEAHFRWEAISILGPIADKTYRLRISRSAVFPHIRRLRLAKVLA